MTELRGRVHPRMTGQRRGCIARSTSANGLTAAAGKASAGMLLFEHHLPTEQVSAAGIY